MGNVTREEAVQVSGTARLALGPGCSAPASIRQRDRCVLLPDGAELMYRCGMGVN